MSLENILIDKNRKFRWILFSQLVGRVAPARTIDSRTYGIKTLFFTDHINFRWLPPLGRSFSVSQEKISSKTFVPSEVSFLKISENLMWIFFCRISLCLRVMYFWKNNSFHWRKKGLFWPSWHGYFSCQKLSTTVWRCISNLSISWPAGML